MIANQASNRLEDKIRELCAKIAAGTGDEDTLAALQKALHQFMKRLRHRVSA